MDWREPAGALQTIPFGLGLEVIALGVSVDEKRDDLDDREPLELCLSVQLYSMHHPCTLSDTGCDI